MNPEVLKSNYYLGIDRYNMLGIEARHEPFPYLGDKDAKTAYMKGINDARERSTDPWARGEE